MANNWSNLFSITCIHLRKPSRKSSMLPFVSRVMEVILKYPVNDSNQKKKQKKGKEIEIERSVLSSNGKQLE